MMSPGEWYRKWKENRKLMKLVDISIFLYHECDKTERQMVMIAMPLDELKYIVLEKGMVEWYEKYRKKDENKEED